MDRRKRSDFGADDRGGRFDKKPGKPEFRGDSKGRTGSYTKKKDDNTGFAGRSTDKRGYAPDRAGYAAGKRSSAERPGLASDRQGSAERAGLSPDRRGAASGYKGSQSGYRGPSTERKGFSSDRRGTLSEQRGFKPDRRDTSTEQRGFKPDRRDTSTEQRGFKPDRREASTVQRGFKPDRRDISIEQRGFKPDRREASTYNRNAKKSAAESKFVDKGTQETDTTGFQDDLDKLEGRNSVIEALKSGRSINRIFVSKGEREGSVNQIIAMARQNHILIQEIDRAKLDEMSVTHAHQGVIALTAAKDYVEVDEILKRAEESGRPPFIIILDEITDPHNLGSMLRTANAAGVHGVIIPKRRAIGLTASVSKASAGAIEYVPVARVTNITAAIENLKKQNIWIVGTDSTGEKAYFESDLTGPVALVIGSEGEGMGKLVRESCDFVVNIPMLGKISSLNAAVAGAIVTYEIFRQRSIKRT